MADLDLLDRVIRLAELANEASDDVREQIVLTLKWINCPVPLTARLGGNTEAALTFARAAQKEGAVARFLRDPPPPPISLG
ncbi:hypothetical protein D3877_01875 [Azospirillum cavernae]|uniref:Uncharacterized protein n=1 Tax=Azospirillum cavernae TaxID=2320860 RepID=A0A418W0F5_9PROT|nr:hypothetical protein [Azospirillum cavernae]RJF83444.1 hypothetical protein D3877_01875 [Azospirillum cavernae]